MTKSLKRFSASAARNIILLAISALILVPVLWMFLSSLRPANQITIYPPDFFPKSLTLKNFERVFKKIPILTYAKNSLIFAVFTTLPSVFISAMAGYAFARFRFKGKNVLFTITLMTLMIPFQVTMIPLFMEIYAMGLYDTYLGLILPRLAVVIGIFMMRSFFAGLPVALEEAGRLDGLTEFGIFFRIMLPQCKPAMITLMVLGVNAAWNDLMYPLLLTSDTSMRMLANGLAMFVGQDTIEYGAAFAGAVISVVPMLLAYILGQKYFVEGTATSGIKG